ncbi:2-C-methyl-D-erythritol 4-phosphate cytidylyltransferase [Granulosicoccus sp.]|nr:2-C-methyl-D-erythritol 4-phosphate cytidylyltransferase [Granulosicoccus sp.]MDB4223309.1 2-C-methyl-D-erythritol 4-phosphate cytidylyltransferase [Granulosicoccus sp.]
MSDQRWIVVPAAGFGERIGGVTPKQYLTLGEQSVLQVTLSQLLQVPDVEGIVVVLAADDSLWSSVPASADPRIHTCIGGDTRADSVVAGLKYVSKKTPVDTWVFVHDAARPLIHLSDVQRLSDAVYNSGAVGGILAARVQDTLKQADEYYYIERSVSRESLWQAQTPQLFKVGALLDALQSALSNNESDDTSITVTDEASAMEYAGHEPLLVEALQPNFKITRPVDLRIATAILNDEVMMS